MVSSFSYVRPTSLKDAIRELSQPGACALAGGTDLLGCLRDGVFTARKVVSIGGLSDLRQIQTGGAGGVRVGALSTLTEVAESPLLKERYSALAQAAASAAGPQLRNQGTIGGNLCQRPRCWYFRGDFDCLRKGGASCFAVSGENELHAIFGGQGCYAVHPSDTAAALVALDAQVRLGGPSGARTLPARAFFVGPEQNLTKECALELGEILTEIYLPPPPAGTRSLYRKVRSRACWDFALVGAAVAARLDGRRVEWARIVLSGVAMVPWRATEAEEALAGRALDAESARRAAEAAVIGAEPMGQNDYKVELVKGVLEEALLSIA